MIIKRCYKTSFIVLITFTPHSMQSAALFGRAFAFLQHAAVNTLCDITDIVAVSHLEEEEKKEKYPVYSDEDLRELFAKLPAVLVKHIEKFAFVQPETLYDVSVHAIVPQTICKEADVIALSANGRYLAIKKDKGRGLVVSEVSVWDTANVRLLDAVQHKLPINYLAISSDKKFIAVVGPYNTDIINISSGALLHRIGAVNGPCVITSDDACLITCDTVENSHALRDRLHKWDVRSGLLLSRLSSFDSKISAIIVDSRGRFINVKTGKGNVFWDTMANKKTMNSNMIVNAVAFSVDSSLMAIGAVDVRIQDQNNTILRIYDPASSQKLLSQSKQPQIQCLAFSRDNSALMISGVDQVSIRDVKTGVGLRRFKMKKKSDNVLFGPNGAFMVTHDNRGKVQLWKPEGAPLVKYAQYLSKQREGQRKKLNEKAVAAGPLAMLQRKSTSN
ncbi:MAG TPA: hypothetical protein VGT41_05855 [Candidatus Babeliales bacterium]|nr:hypothetical protein [Candidatus Babeliales bacterium]